MSQRYFLGVFEQEDDILGATQAARGAGYEIADIYTPYAVHGLDRAMGLPHSRLTWACFGFGVLGLLCAVALQFWTTWLDWPINVGGKPWNSLPAFVPVIFELTVLLAGLGSVGSLLFVTRLYPGKRVKLADPRVTNDRFVIKLANTNASFDAERVKELFRPYHPVAFHEVIDDGGAQS